MEKCIAKRLRLATVKIIVKNKRKPKIAGTITFMSTVKSFNEERKILSNVKTIRKRVTIATFNLNTSLKVRNSLFFMRSNIFLIIPTTFQKILHNSIKNLIVF